MILHLNYLHSLELNPAKTIPFYREKENCSKLNSLQMNHWSQVSISPIGSYRVLQRSAHSFELLSSSPMGDRGHGSLT